MDVKGAAKWTKHGRIISWCYGTEYLTVRITVYSSCSRLFEMSEKRLFYYKCNNVTTRSIYGLCLLSKWSCQQCTSVATIRPKLPPKGMLCRCTPAGSYCIQLNRVDLSQCYNEIEILIVIIYLKYYICGKNVTIGTLDNTSTNLLRLLTGAIWKCTDFE